MVAAREGHCEGDSGGEATAGEAALRAVGSRAGGVDAGGWEQRCRQLEPAVQPHRTVLSKLLVINVAVNQCAAIDSLYFPPTSGT